MSKDRSNAATPLAGTPSPAYKDPQSSIPLRPGLGEVTISHDILPTIVCYAALETRGVVSLAGKYSVDEIQNKKEAERGITVTAHDASSVIVKLEVNIEFGYNIYDTTLRLQQSVKNAVENMSNFTVKRIDVQVRGVVPQKHAPRTQVETL